MVSSAEEFEEKIRKLEPEDEYLAYLVTIQSIAIAYKASNQQLIRAYYDIRNMEERKKNIAKLKAECVEYKATFIWTFRQLMAAVAEKIGRMDENAIWELYIQ